ncbi:MAG: hypothetical protein ACI8TS_000022 [Flavobacteriales bacterium]|jgi:hypothetical protein
MNIFKFRVVIDMEEDIFRDIEIVTGSSFLELHEAILRAFNFKEGEMASFYMSNDTWERGEEITLMDVEVDEELEATSTIKSMSTVALEMQVSHPDDKVIYVYDFLRMWCFYIELVEIRKAAPSTLYPRVALVYGEAPALESKEVDLFAGFDMPDEGKVDYKTGDPELDAYLDGDDDDESQSFSSLDDLDDDLY